MKLVCPKFISSEDSETLIAHFPKHLGSWDIDAGNRKGEATNTHLGSRRIFMVNTEQKDTALAPPAVRKKERLDRRPLQDKGIFGWIIFSLCGMCSIDWWGVPALHLGRGGCLWENATR